LLFLFAVKPMNWWQRQKKRNEREREEATVVARKQWVEGKNLSQLF